MARLSYKRCSKLRGHLHLLHITESPACMCGFVNEDEFNFSFVCLLYYSRTSECHLTHSTAFLKNKNKTTKKNLC